LVLRFSEPQLGAASRSRISKPSQGGAAVVTRIGINGFGRIGRMVFRAIHQNQAGVLEVAAVNDLADAKMSAHLVKHDTNYGAFQGTVDVQNGDLLVNERVIKVLAQRDPAKIPWGDMGVDLVVESTGFFTDRDGAAGHLKGGAKKVIISAPAKGDDVTVVIGVNEETYDPAKHEVISNASCTTNCVAPLAKVLNDSFTVKRGFMSTVHSYTNDQQILDHAHSDPRRSRAAAMNIIPTTTGAAKAVGLVLPELNGKLHGMSLRVPTSTVSLIDLVVDVERKVTVEEVNEVFREASEGRLKGILAYTEEELVSSDFRGDPHSCILDAPSTMVIDGTMVKVLGWYDNEWGYSNRVADLARIVVGKGL
jgi:glyceraldehyde 3-phosphate dehydrogenase